MTIKYLLLILFTMVCSTIVFGADLGDEFYNSENVNASYTLALSGAYVSNGIKSTGNCFQPSIDFTHEYGWGGLNYGVWSTFDISKSEVSDETDPYFSLSYNLSTMFSWSLGYTLWNYSKDTDRNENIFITSVFANVFLSPSFELQYNETSDNYDMVFSINHEYSIIKGIYLEGKCSLGYINKVSRSDFFYYLFSLGIRKNVCSFYDVLIGANITGNRASNSIDSSYQGGRDFSFFTISVTTSF